MGAERIRILCVDDHVFVVEGLKARLQIEPDMEVVGRLDSADRLLEEVERSRPDIVLLDIEMPGSDAFDAIAALQRRHPNVRVIMLTAYVRDHYVDAAYRAGAWGYISKSDSPETVVEGIRSVMRGEVTWSDPAMGRSHLERVPQPAGRDGGASRLSQLTARERQILRMIARGLSRTEIAETISRSPMTVDNHRKSLMRKLDINDRAELVRYAIAEGIVEV